MLGYACLIYHWIEPWTRLSMIIEILYKNHIILYISNKQRINFLSRGWRFWNAHHSQTQPDFLWRWFKIIYRLFLHETPSGKTLEQMIINVLQAFFAECIYVKIINCNDMSLMIILHEHSTVWSSGTTFCQNIFQNHIPKYGNHGRHRCQWWFNSQCLRGCVSQTSHSNSCTFSVDHTFTTKHSSQGSWPLHLPTKE